MRPKQKCGHRKPPRAQYRNYIAAVFMYVQAGLRIPVRRSGERNEQSPTVVATKDPRPGLAVRYPVLRTPPSRDLQKRFYGPSVAATSACQRRMIERATDRAASLARIRF